MIHKKRFTYDNVALDGDGDIWGHLYSGGYAGQWHCLTATTVPEFVVTQDLLEFDSPVRFLAAPD